MKKEAVAAVSNFQNCVVDYMNVSVAMAYQNQKKLDVEVKNLQSNTAKLTKQIGDWIKLSTAFNQGLKELGDIENWAATLEADMRMISTSLEYAYNCEKS